MIPARLPRQLAQLLLGLWLYGATMACMVEAGLGLDPWDVFHEGLTIHTGLSFGAVTAIVGGFVLLLWIPLRQRPGIGTVLNVIVVSIAVDVTLAWIPDQDGAAVRIALLLVGIVGNGLAGAMYVGADLGPGPRDGLWIGIVRRSGHSVRVIRTGLEVTVLVVGVILGGTVGIGTVLYALSIGPIVQAFLPHLQVATGPDPVDPTLAPAQ